jgi:hypothetical protein
MLEKAISIENSCGDRKSVLDLMDRLITHFDFDSQVNGGGV